MSAGTIVSRYCSCRRGGCVGAASFSAGFAGFASLGFFASLAGFASSAGGLPAGFASLAPLAPFTSLSLFSLAMVLASNVHDFAVGLEEAHLAGGVGSLRFQERESDPVARSGGGVQQHCGVGVELDHRAVRAAHAVRRAHDHRGIDLALLHATARRSTLDADLDDVADARVAAL